jgi:hypothetical protein
MKSEIGQRGKYAEKEVETYLKKLNAADSGFAYFRLADSRAARGMIAASPADFLYFRGGVGGFIEVKSSSHPFRIAKDKISQLPTLNKFDKAGAKSWVLLHHSSLNRWRIAPSTYFPMGVPSWIVDGLPLFDSAESALKAVRVC